MQRQQIISVGTSQQQSGTTAAHCCCVKYSRAQLIIKHICSSDGIRPQQSLSLSSHSVAAAAAAAALDVSEN